MMHIDKYKQESGWYMDEDGTSYETAEDFFQGMFNFCGCGCPDLSLEFIRDSLQHVHDLHNLVHPDKITWMEWNSTGRRLFHTNGIEYFTYYFLDANGLTTHGGSVPGWLTEKGKELLEDLNEWLSYKDDDE
jgi:hypothetical protein